SRVRGRRSGWSAHPTRAGDEGAPHTARPARGILAGEACTNSHDHPTGWSSWPPRSKRRHAEHGMMLSAGGGPTYATLAHRLLIRVVWQPGHAAAWHQDRPRAETPPSPAPPPARGWKGPRERYR